MRKKELLMEMFSHLTEEQVDYLSSLNEDINIIITRVLDNNIEPLKLDIKDLAFNHARLVKLQKDYHYPEIFQDYYETVDVTLTRQASGLIFKQISSLRQKALIDRMRSEVYNSEADRLKERADWLDRKAAITIMRTSMESPGPLDVHGLYVKECLMFLEDLYLNRKFKAIEIATGQPFNSSKLRPNVKQWLEMHKFIVIDEGPIVRGIRCMQTD